MMPKHGTHRAGRHAGMLVLAALVAAGTAAAQDRMYKWKDAAGVTHYSDTPPAKGQVRVLRADSRPDAAPALPYELARAARLYPVILYTTAHCDACDRGRALLRARGIPFAEKTVTTPEDRQALHGAGGKDALPLLAVGRRQLTGFAAVAWNEALDSASYPREAMLPPGYRTGAVDAAAPASLPAPPPRLPAAPAPDAAAAQAGRQQPRQQPQPGQTPPDFQF